MNYFIKTFGCQQNKADSERIASAFEARGMRPARGYSDADYVVINTCMVKRPAEDRVYGLVRNLGKLKKNPERSRRIKIIVTGCMIGLAFRDKTGKYLSRIRELMPDADEFMPIEEVGFDSEPVRQDREKAWVPISNGCNNFCTFCVVPFTRGREISRSYQDIITECLHLRSIGYKQVTLLGQNVNSYGADLILGEKNIQVMRDIGTTYFKKISNSQYPISNENSNQKSKKNVGNGKLGIGNYTPVYVKHLGRYRIPTLFPQLLEEVAKMDFEKVDFMSSNPWDFSDELIEVIARNPNITRTVHLPVQSGDSSVLKRMNRWYSRDEYLKLVANLKFKIKNLKLTTDIIVGFCGETEKEFHNTVDLCRRVGFAWAFVSMYSVRPMTVASKVFEDDVPHEIKKKRWLILDELVNKPQLRKQQSFSTISNTLRVSP